MKKNIIILSIFAAISLLFFSIPLSSVAMLEITVVDQNGRKITDGLNATYFDDKKTAIVKITSKTRGSWENNLLWWTSSKHGNGKTTPADALRTTLVRIDAKDCKSISIPISLNRTYVPISISPHSGGAAHFIYRFDKSATLQCE